LHQGRPIDVLEPGVGLNVFGTVGAATQTLPNGFVQEAANAVLVRACARKEEGWADRNRTG